MIGVELTCQTCKQVVSNHKKADVKILVENMLWSFKCTEFLSSVNIITNPIKFIANKTGLFWIIL